MNVLLLSPGPLEGFEQVPAFALAFALFLAALLLVRSVVLAALALPLQLGREFTHAALQAVVLAHDGGRLRALAVERRLRLGELGDIVVQDLLGREPLVRRRGPQRLELGLDRRELGVGHRARGEESGGLIGTRLGCLVAGARPAVGGNCAMG